MNAEETQAWITGFLAVKLHKTPEEIRAMPTRDAMLVMHTIAFMNEEEERILNRKVKRWNTA